MRDVESRALSRRSGESRCRRPRPDFSVQDVYRGWCTGLREIGVDVVEFNLNDRLGFFTEIQLERR